MNNIKIYPNPSNDILNIGYSGVEALEATSIKIINSLEQLIKEDVLRLTQQPNGSVSATTNANEVANGVYFLKLASRGTRDLKTDPSLRQPHYKAYY